LALLDSRVELVPDTTQPLFGGCAFPAAYYQEQPPGGGGIPLLPCVFGPNEQLIGLVRQLFQSMVEVIGRFAGQGKDFHLSIPVRCGLLRAVFFENGVEVAASEAEGRHRSPAGMLGGGKPGADLRVEIKRAVGLLQEFQWLTHFQGGWQHFVVQSQYRLDERGSSSRRLGMADLRFDAP
jgi:hypothetical protein